MSLVLKSIAAIVIGFIVFIGGTVLSALFIMFLCTYVFEVGIFKKDAVEVAAAGFGAGGGIVLAKGACDYVLRKYSGKAVVISFFILVIAAWIGTIAAWKGLDKDFAKLVAQSIATIYVGLATFWAEDPIGKIRAPSAPTRLRSDIPASD